MIQFRRLPLNSGFNGVDMLALDASVFVVWAVTLPIPPGPCHGVAGFAGLGLDEKARRVDLLDVFGSNPFAPLFSG
jgi:hypothetical protein